MVYADFTELIGHTPLLRLKRLEAAYGLQATLLAKLEYFNPAGSAKDRVAYAMIADAEARGLLREGSVIIEPTSGNTGIGLAAVAACKGYRLVLTMPETMSVERRNLLKAYGAELVLTEGKKGMQGAIDKARALLAETPGGYMPGQFDNPANPRAHYQTTGPEIYAQTEGALDAFVACAGTGGTVSGVGRYLKEISPRTRVVAVEPSGSPVLSGGQPGPHGIQGIGAGFVPKNYDPAVVDEVLCVSDADAFHMGNMAVKKEGILVGISSGAALWAAMEVAKRPEFAGKTVVAFLPDTGERYLSTAMFEA